MHRQLGHGITNDAHLGNARDTAQRAGEPASIGTKGQRVAAPAHRHREHRQVGFAEPFDHRLLHFARQITARCAHRVAHLLNRLARHLAEHELGEQQRVAITGRTLQLLEPRDAAHPIFEWAQQFALDLGRCRARIRHGDRHHGRLHIGPLVGLEAAERQYTSHCQHQHGDDRDNWTTNRQVGNPHVSVLPTDCDA